MPCVYDGWAAMGHPDWGWDSVAPYFRKVEDARGHARAEHLGRDGPVQMLQHESWFELHRHIDASARNVGLPVQQDANDPEGPAMGYFSLDYTIDSDGHRHSALRAYLPKQVAIERQSRLNICTGAIVSHIELDVEKGRATGVCVRQTGAGPGKEVLIKARREVIVCNGAICSPQLLQLSGIGPASLLRSHDITVQKDLPGVGSHLSDHHGIPICLELPYHQTYHLMENPLRAAWQLLLYTFNRTGWMKSATTNSSIFLNTDHLDTETSSIQAKPGDREFDASAIENVPDIEIMVIPASTVMEFHPGRSLFTLYTCLIQPHSHGRVEIASKDPEESPDLEFDLLANPRDLEVARKAVRFTMHLADNFVVRSGYRHPAKLFLAPNAASGRSWKDVGDDEIDEYVRETVQSALHLGCSCRMGKEEEGGVVDNMLRVHGFTNLRVADASVFPKIPAAHTMAPTYMVAERCADFIKAAWR
ncbi:hypothetical protein F5Y15DRAFT_376973 [Xylariaceae sp. FL0016]|nr:hypothetical protein F5Y15DRAFT_376973 [Xylariaceae sp. FL0016]